MGLWSTVTGQEEESNELCPSLTYKQRLIGFIGTLSFGFFLSVLSWFAVFQRNWVQFGIFMTAANLTTIGGSMFLAGPVKQFKKMFEETRWIATSVYIVMMVLTVVAAVQLKNPPLVIVCCVFQYLAMIWYGLSYVPFARTLVKNCIKGMV